MRMHVVVIPVCAVIGWYTLSGLYSYFTDSTFPVVQIVGLEAKNVYRGTLTPTISVQKTSDIQVIIDGRERIASFKGKPGVLYPCAIKTEGLSQGEHIFTLQLTDRTYRQNKTKVEVPFVVDNMSLSGNLVRPTTNSSLQGRTVHVVVQTNKDQLSGSVRAFGNQYPCAAENSNNTSYEAFIPVACEEVPGEYPYTVELNDRVGNTIHIEGNIVVVSAEFKREVISISPEKIAQEEQAGAQSRVREELMRTLALASDTRKLWRGSFSAPIDIERVSCPFGTIRTTQHKGKYAHKAVDVVNKPKSVVWAPQDGIVVIKDRFADTGNTIVIDHGMGVLTLLCHLDTFAKIDVGDKIVAGNPVGTIGKTGFATGYHLHWEMRINNVHVDPLQWTEPLF